MVKREKANYMIQSVSHAIDVLEELSQVESEIGVTELSKRLKLHKNNVFRLLATLELRGFVEQNMDTEDYRLGVKVLQLGQAFSNQNTLVTRARPILRSLSESTGETCSLVTLQNGNVHFPLSIDSKKPVKVAGRAAVSFPAKQSAAGRLLMANLPDAMLNELLATNTPQDAAIRGQMNELRTSGQIADRGVIESDVIAIAKIVRGQKNEIVAAIEVTIPQYRAKLEAITPLLDKAALELSTSLGSSKTTLTSSIEKEVSSMVKPAVMQSAATK